MELELRVRLSERPVPPGCGQSGQEAQPRAAAGLCSPGPWGRGLTSQSPCAPATPPTPAHLHRDCAALPPACLPRQELGFPNLSPWCPGPSRPGTETGNVAWGEARQGHRTRRPAAPGPGRPPTHTWTGSSTLLLRKFRELARFILRGKEGPCVSMVELGKEGEGGQAGFGGGRLMGGEQLGWVVELLGPEARLGLGAC